MAGREVPARAPHQPQAISLQVERMPTGQLRVSTAQARGWAAVAGNPMQLARVMAEAFREVQRASYARLKGEAYDLDVLTEHRPGDPLAGSQPFRVRRLGGGNQPYPAAAWSKVTGADGVDRWRSPSGRLYRADTQAALRVVEKRRELDLPV